MQISWAAASVPSPALTSQTPGSGTAPGSGGWAPRAKALAAWVCGQSPPPGSEIAKSLPPSPGGRGEGALRAQPCLQPSGQRLQGPALPRGRASRPEPCARLASARQGPARSASPQAWGPGHTSEDCSQLFQSRLASGWRVREDKAGLSCVL